MAEWWNESFKTWFLNMQYQWWENLPGMEKVFWLLAIPFTVVFLVQFLATFLGLGPDEVDPEPDGSFDLFGMRLLTIRNLTIFFMVFGWTGVTLSQSGSSEGVTLAVAILLGLLMMFLVGGLFILVMRLAQSGTTEMRYAKGQMGQVYIPIPQEKSGKGKIHVTFQGSLKEVEAMTEGDSLPTGTLVKVLDVINDQILLVERVTERRSTHV